MSRPIKASIPTLLLIAACASDGGDDSGEAAEISAAGDASVEKKKAPENIATVAAAEQRLAEDLKLLASQARIRPANFYKLERSYEPSVCDAALAALNKPFAVPEDLHTYWDLDGMPWGDRDYASHQAAYYLGTNDNVRWSWRSFQYGEHLFKVESAILDLLGDGEYRLVWRQYGRTAGGIRLGLAVFEASDVEHSFKDLSVRGFEIDEEYLPDKDRIGTKLEYSVKDLINLGGRLFPLLMPLRDYDKSGRVYLAKWNKGDVGILGAELLGAGRRNWRPTLICTFVPRNNQ